MQVFEVRSFTIVPEIAGADDNSCVYCDPATLEQMGLYRGDTVKLFARGKATVAIVLSAAEGSLCAGDLRMNKSARLNLGVLCGETVTMEANPDVPYATKVHVLPVADTLEGAALAVLGAWSSTWWRRNPKGQSLWRQAPPFPAMACRSSATSLRRPLLDFFTWVALPSAQRPSLQL